MPEQNPLLQAFELPPFSQVRTGHLAPAAEALIVESRRQVEEIIQTQTLFPTWDDLVLAMDNIHARLDAAQNTVRMLTVVDSEKSPRSRALVAMASLALADNPASNDSSALTRGCTIIVTTFW